MEVTSISWSVGNSVGVPRETCVSLVRGRTGANELAGGDHEHVLTMAFGSISYGLHQ